jgi:hypothetical protein
MIRSVPVGVVYLSLARHATKPVTCLGPVQRRTGPLLHGDSRTGHDPWNRDVSLTTVTAGEEAGGGVGAIPRSFSEMGFKNGLNSVAGDVPETMRAVHEWITAAATAVTFRRSPKTFRASVRGNEPLGARSRTVC